MVSFFVWRLQGQDEVDDIGERARKLEEYQLAAAAHGIEIRCPECEAWVASRFTSKGAAMAEGERHEREQFLSGLCSDACWKAHLGLSEEAAP